MNWIKRILGLKGEKPCTIQRVRLMLPDDEMTEFQKTDVVLGWNLPFMTMTESKMSNVWYHHDFNWLCKWTKYGFKVENFAFKGSKETLIKNGFGR